MKVNKERVKIKTSSESINDSFLLPLIAIAHESRKIKPLLKDDKAIEIHDKLNNVIARRTQKDDLSHYAFIFRTIWFDRLIKDFIWRYPNGTVINIGCGLDTTCVRLDTGSVRWYDIDLPEIISLRKLFISETESRKFICSSFLKNEWLGEIMYDDAILIFASGVYYYYNERTIRKFFAKLSFVFPSFELMFDVTSPAGMRAANRLVRKAGMTDGPFLKWGIRDYRTILEWNPRMRFLGKYRIFHRAAGRVPLKCLIPSLVSDALSIQNILHLKVRYDYRKLGER